MAKNDRSDSGASAGSASGGSHRNGGGGRRGGSRASAGSAGSASPRVAAVHLQDPWSPSELRGGVPILVVVFATGKEFLAALRAEAGPAGMLLVKTRATPAPGTPLVLEVAWHGLPNRLFLRAWAGERTRGGRLQIRLDPDESEVAKRDFLVGAASGAITRFHRRRHRRFCVRLPVRWRRFGESDLKPAMAEDLSAGGILVATSDDAVRVLDKVAVRLHADTADLVLTGQVRHVTPRMRGGLVFGLKFEYRAGGEQRSLRQLLRTFASKGVVLLGE